MAARPALATSITFSPSTVNVGVGSSSSVDILVSNRGGVTIGGFGFDVLFNSADISVTSVNYGTDLGNPTDSSQTIVSTDLSVSGDASLLDLSLLSTSSLSALQTTDSFLLARINFTGKTPSISSLQFSNLDFTDAAGNVLSVTPAGGTVDVLASTAVPEPGTMLLMGSGLMLVARRMRSRKIR
jgi:hypothetical protein